MNYLRISWWFVGTREDSKRELEENQKFEEEKRKFEEEKRKLEEAQRTFEEDKRKIEKGLRRNFQKEDGQKISAEKFKRHDNRNELGILFFN